MHRPVPFLSHPGPRSHKRAARRSCALLALGVTLALVTACAQRDTRPPQTDGPFPIPPYQTTPRAEATYSYLVYRDALRQGRGQEAEAALSEVVRLDPQPDLYLELAELKWRLGRPAEARETVKQALTAFPDEPQLNLRLADAYVAEQRLDDAALTLESYLARKPEQAIRIEALQRLAQVRLEQGNFDAALTILSNVPKDAVTADTFYLRAKAYQGLEQNTQAERALRRALDVNPDHLPALVELAYSREVAGDLREAERLFGRLLKLGETNREVFLKLISLNLKLDNPAKALTLARIGPRDPAFTLEAARLFINADYKSQAQELLEPLVQDPTPSAEALFFLANIAFEADGPEDALALLRRVPADSPLDAKAAGFRAQILLLQQRGDEALADIRSARARHPDDPELPEAEAWILERQGEYSAALEVLDTALARWPDDVPLLYRRGMALERLGRDQEALESVERALALEPNNAEAQNFVGYMLAEKGRDLDRALTLIRAALEQLPDSPSIVDSLAWAHYKRGEYAEAWKAINRALELGGIDPVIWEHYAEIATALGKTPQARKGFTQALETGHPEPERIRDRLESL